ncbi:MAG: hypothetical protein ACTSVS_02590 [Candidatus Heimdallarchaeota archaeon]
MDKNIKINPDSIDQELVKKILRILYEYGQTSPCRETSFLGIAEKMESDFSEKVSYSKLKRHLLYLEQKGLIEERHFEENFSVDYDFEEKGLQKARELFEKTK